MRLEVLFDGLDIKIVCGTPDKDVKALVYHSAKAVPESVFFAIGGAESHGKDFLEEAAEKGAETLVTDEEDEETEKLLRRLSRTYGITGVRVRDARKALAKASSRFYGHPDRDLKLIGVTGTKGKTTTTFMIKEILEEAGIKTGIIGTVVSGYDGSYSEAINTTPQSEDIHRALRDMVNAGCHAAVMEVSSQGLMQHRTYGLDFDTAVFTNLYPDHIGKGEHGSLEEYIYWKSMLFRQTKTAIINIDDSHWREIISESTAERLLTFSAEQPGADFAAEDIVLRRKKDLLGVDFTMGGKAFFTGMPGKFNAYNALAAASCAASMDLPISCIQRGLSRVKVRGRAEAVSLGEDFTVLIDYAHNGPALESLLKALREYEPARLIAVFGCGGNRDRNRRFEMGRAAAQLADFSVVTSDNPRHENPMDIIRDVTQAMAEEQGSYTVIPDRRKAIGWTVSQAQTGDIIVIAGKGHETYQILGSEKRHFDDREIVLSVMERI